LTAIQFNHPVIHTNTGECLIEYASPNASVHCPNTKGVAPLSEVCIRQLRNLRFSHWFWRSGFRRLCLRRRATGACTDQQS
jgi:hypothetical protein